MPKTIEERVGEIIPKIISELSDALVKGKRHYLPSEELLYIKQGYDFVISSTDNFAQDEVLRVFKESAKNIILLLINILLFYEDDGHCVQFQRDMKLVIKEFVNLNNFLFENRIYFTATRSKINVFQNEKRQFVEKMESYMNTLFSKTDELMKQCTQYTPRRTYCPKPPTIDNFFLEEPERQKYERDYYDKIYDPVTHDYFANDTHEWSSTDLEDEKIDKELNEILLRVRLENLKKDESNHKSKSYNNPKLKDFYFLNNHCTKTTLDELNTRYRIKNKTYIGNDNIRNRIRENYQKLKEECAERQKELNRCIDDDTNNYFRDLSEESSMNSFKLFDFPHDKINRLKKFEESS